MGKQYFFECPVYHSEISSRMFKLVGSTILAPLPDLLAPKPQHNNRSKANDSEAPSQDRRAPTESNLIQHVRREQRKERCKVAP